MMQSSEYASLQAILYDVGERRHKYLDFYLSQYNQQFGRVFEPMCGTGFYLLHFLKNGICIDGSDLSEGMLARCRAKCQDQGFRPNLYRQPLEELDLPERYGFVFIPDGSFSHLYEPQVAQVALERLFRHMNPGGKLLIDLHKPLNPPWEVGKWLGHWHECEDGSLILVSSLNRYEDENRIFKCVAKYERFVDGKLAQVEQSMYAVRFYEKEAFTSMLLAVGFVEIRSEVSPETGEKDPTSMLFECFKPM